MSASFATGKVNYFYGPNGNVVTVADLPSRHARWLPQRKAELVLAVKTGLLSAEAACQRYNLTSEELQSWERALDEFGVAGLRTTRTQLYREARTRGQTGNDGAVDRQ